MCKYSKFRIESNSYLLFDSIRNWRNYSKISNTYLTVISWAIDTRFVVLCQPQAAALTWRWIQCCATCVPIPPTPLTTHGSCRLWEANTAHGQLSAGLSVSIVMDSTLIQRHATFKVRGDTGAANVILSLALVHAARCLVSAAHVRKTTSAQLHHA